MNPYFSTAPRQPVGLFPSVPEGGTATIALIAVGLVFAYMVLKPSKKPR